ncbi:peptide synthetase [Streptomyces natalensis ATCC 27448]|uniref:Peptide synthetase n=1 Tax=Streptomyces natalensis ATCC 27448 TaxID=1240678 RepID=A0A0D7CPB7_9ACTN|nr:peptide synthetase [Streptomyces natalensis ATCC 27448]
MCHVVDVLDHAAAARGGELAVTDDHGDWSYAQLADHSRRFAQWLHHSGVSAGDRVVVRATASREFVAMLYGCLRAGAVFVPLGPATTAYQLGQVVADAQPRLVITDRTPPDETAATARSLQEVWAEVRRPGGPAPHTRAEAAPADTALLIYTSGSTAAPKAVVSPHERVLWATRAVAARLRYQTDDIVLCRLPLAFDYGLYQVFLCALAGARLVLLSQAADLRLAAVARECGATVVPLVPSLATMLLHSARRDPGPSRIRLFTNTGEELPHAVLAQLREHFPRAGIQLMYGTTECKRISVLEVDGDRRRPGSVGRSLDGTRIRILTADGVPAAPGETGEIVVSGPHVMAGYWRAPELTAARFRSDPQTGEVRLHTGDFGHLDSDGYLYFHGRGDDMFKRHGVRTSAAEIESAARDIPGVDHAVLLPPTDRRDMVLCVVTTLTPAEVLRHLGTLLDPARVPDQCRVFDRFPLSANGKTDRAWLSRQAVS